MTFTRSQRTLASPAIVQGYGYWSGKDVRVELRPAPAGAGITFIRDDFGPEARIPALAENRIDIPRRTCLRIGRVQVDMVEHVLAALKGMRVDNCEIGVNQQELPGCDGSAMDFVKAIEEAGSVNQPLGVEVLEVTETIHLEYEESWIEARPAAEGGLSVEFHLDYPCDPVIGQQSVAVEITPERFREEIAPCRTFLLEREAKTLIRNGLGSRVSTRDLLVFGEQGPIGNQLRFANECARHKALDVIGDLALTGCEVVARIVAHRSSHCLNAALAGVLVNSFRREALKASA